MHLNILNYDRKVKKGNLCEYASKKDEHRHDFTMNISLDVQNAAAKLFLLRDFVRNRKQDI